MVQNADSDVSLAAALVLVVDDDPDVGRLVRAVLGEVGLRVRDFPNPQALWGSEDLAEAACLVLDVRLPGQSGLEVQAELSRRGLGIPVVFVSGCSDVATAVQAMKAGACHFLEKPFSPQQLLDAVQQAIGRYRRERDRQGRRAEFRRRWEGLSERQRQVLAGLVAGKANKALARELGIASHTVEVHRAQVLRKMQAGSLAELVRMAQVLGPDPAVGDAACPAPGPSDPADRSGYWTGGSGMLENPSKSPAIKSGLMAKTAMKAGDLKVDASGAV